jgi:hypothetical protein
MICTAFVAPRAPVPQNLSRVFACGLPCDAKVQVAVGHDCFLGSFFIALGSLLSRKLAKLLPVNL